MDPNGGIRFLFFIPYTSCCFTSVNAVQRFFCAYFCGNFNNLSNCVKFFSKIRNCFWQL